MYGFIVEIVIAKVIVTVLRLDESRIAEGFLFGLFFKLGIVGGTNCVVRVVGTICRGRCGTAIGEFWF